ncbi:MAG: hypothetical protein LC650_05255 [Actinobacteria bacterium]|nr:hypothetical protein [Actinomycetota bacterium]
MNDILEDKEVAIPLPEYNAKIVLSLYYSVIKAREEWRSYEERGADGSTYKIVSTLESLFLYISPMVKRSDKELHKALLEFLKEPGDMTELFPIIMKIGDFLDEKNITKVDMRIARSKRGVEHANQAKGY